MASTRPIFVVGCPRSGTTMFTMMLHAHSRIAMPPETRFLLRVYRRQLAFGDLTVPENRAKLADAIVRGKGTKFRDLGLDRRQVRRAIVDGPPTVGSAVGTVFRLYADRFGKQRWGDKRPIYYQSIPAIRRMFPDAQFVHLVRDGRDCAASLLRVPWHEKGAIAAIALWTEAIAYGRRAARRLPSDTWYELQYEHLVANPRAELEKLCDFLDEDFEEGMLEPHKVADQAVPGRKSWHANTRAEISTRSVGSYADVLSPDEVRLFEYVAKDELRQFGYDVPDDPPRPPAGLLARYVGRSVVRRGRIRALGLYDRLVALRSGPAEDRG